MEESFQQENCDRMEEEGFKKVYIVKLPNNFCGIGACVIDHPKKVKSSFIGADTNKYFFFFRYQ